MMRGSFLISMCLLSPVAAFLQPGAVCKKHKIICCQRKQARATITGGRPCTSSRQVQAKGDDRATAVLYMGDDEQDGPQVDDKMKPTSEDPSLAVKAAWYGSELFGNIIGIGKTKDQQAKGEKRSASPVLAREEAVARLKMDFDRFYFVTGQMDLDLYEEDCTFADPFVAFQGRQRFKNNLDNLGSLMQNVSLDVTGWEDAESSLKTKWRFKCVLGLPWKPILAASGGTEFFFSGSGRIERHVESWDIEPMDALRQLIKPGRKLPMG